MVTGTTFHDAGNAASLLVVTAGRDGAGPAIVEAGAGRIWSFSELHDAALAIAGHLRAQGLRPGDRVAILLERGGLSAAAYFGALAAGAVAVNVNEGLKPRQVSYILAHSGAGFLMTVAPFPQRLGDAVPGDVRVIDAGEAIASGASGGVEPRTGGDVAHLIYTSGSTGMPKGVTVSHANVWAGMRAVVEYLGIRGDDRIASLLPFSFDYGLNQLLCCAGTGATLVVQRTPVPQRIVQTLVDERVTVLPAVPPLWLQLLTADRFASPLSALRAMTNTGGRVPTDAVRRLREFQPQADLVLMYGLTEAFRSTWLPPALVDAKPDSMGRAIPGAEILVLRDDNTPCEPGEVGQLVHRGPTVALGYWNDRAATAERFGFNPVRPAGTPEAERVVFSGDLVRMDDDGDLYFVGRRDKMIKSMGHRVGPDEVVDILYASGEIVEAVVIAEADEMRGDAIVAHVVLREDGDLERLKAFASREMPRYMQPVRYEVRETLARTASGKHDPRALVA